MISLPDPPQPSPDQPASPDALGDPDLLTAVRAGDPDAFATLYTRHVDAARRLALALTRNQPDADDLVAEAFAKLLTALRSGGGPGVAFRAYLLTTLRNLFYSRVRRDQRVSPTDDLSSHDTAVPFEDPVVERLEQTLVARAFARLPERWQTVLWHTEVEGETPATVAPMLDLTPNGVAVLAYRARERLRQNYLREHVTESPDGECQSTIDRLGGYVREGLSQRDRAAVAEHLASCRRCQVLYLELGDVNASLRGLLAPVVLGPAAAAAYLGSPAGGFTALLAPVWSGAKRISRRRSTQVGAAGSVMVAAALAVALILTSGPAPELETGGPLPPGAGPDSADPDASDGSDGSDGSGTDHPSPGVPVAGTGPGSGGSGDADPAGGSGPGASGTGLLPLAVTLEPVGALVRDRPGVLALAVTALDPAGGAGGESAPAAMATAQAAGVAAETGPLAAVVTVPDGVALRTGAPGGGWTCTGGSGQISCERPSLPAGSTARAYLPVWVTATAAGTAPRVRLTGSGAETTSATAARGAENNGLSATFAGLLPATVVTGGNALLSCPRLDLTCSAARGGKGALGRTDNDDYLMARYVDSAAPAGAPRRAAVSGATIQVPGEVVWAGLYWAGSGGPPRSPTAYLHAPGRAGYTTVAATTVREVGGTEFGQTAYQASAEVTDLVRGSGGGGQWWVAVDADAFHPGLGSFGGWALMIVAKDGGADRTVTVFEGLTPLRDRRSFTAPVYGQPGSGRIGFIAWDGDRGAGGAQLRLDDAPVGGADQNIAASLADGTPAGWNTLGTDARVLDTSVAGPGGAGPPTLTATTGRHNPWLLGTVAVITPAP